MSRVLLVDDSPHAQRMGERILSDEGFEVVTVSNADSALIRLDDVDPDVVLADTVMPGRTGYDICQYLKMSPRHKHVRVILTAGVLEALDEEQTRRVEADGTLKKPFEATALIAAVRPLAEAAAEARARNSAGPGAPSSGPAKPAPAAPFVAVVDAEQIRAAVTIALEGSIETIVDEIAARVLTALSSRKPDDPARADQSRDRKGASELPSMPLTAAPQPDLPRPAEPSSPPPLRLDTVRRVNPLRLRSGSILGLDIGRTEPEDPNPRNPPQ